MEQIRRSPRIPRRRVEVSWPMSVKEGEGWYSVVPPRPDGSPESAVYTRLVKATTIQEALKKSGVDGAGYVRKLGWLGSRSVEKRSRRRQPNEYDQAIRDIKRSR